MLPVQDSLEENMLVGHSLLLELFLCLLTHSRIRVGISAVDLHLLILRKKQRLVVPKNKVTSILNLKNSFSITKLQQNKLAGLEIIL